MSWRDNLHKGGMGSFRGLEFYVPRVDSQIGRRIVVHRYPGRNDPGIEDNGREPREFTLECFVLGDNYFYERDQLREAFEKKGPGPLTHPYWGDFTVVINGTTRISERWEEGRIARFTLNVIEVGDTLSPVVKPDTAAAVEIAADEAVAKVFEDFEDAFDVVGYIENVVSAAVDLVNAVASDLNKIKGYVNAVMAIADTVADAISAVTDAVSTLILLPGQLIDSVQSIINSISASIASIGDAWSSYYTDDESADSITGTPSTSPTSATPTTSDKRVDLLMRAWRELVAFGDDLEEVTGTTGQREQQSTNQDAFVIAIKSLATIETCRTIAQIPFASADKAFEVRDELLATFDDLLADADDNTYAALMDLRLAIVDYLNSITAELPRVVTYTPARPIPALVLSQILYGSSAYDTEIIERNNIHNPCQIPAGEELEVLSNV